MGNVKRHNRTLPLHPDHHTENVPDIFFFEEIIKREVDKAVHDAETHTHITYYPEATTDMRNRMNRPQ